MIIAVSGLFQIPSIHRIENRMLMTVCYDAESHDDAKRDFLCSDQCLKTLEDGYNLIGLHTLQININAVVAVCKEAAKTALDALFEAVEEKKKSQEGEDE